MLHPLNVLLLFVLSAIILSPFFPPFLSSPPPQLWELGEEKTRKIEEGKLMTKMIINTQTQQQQITTF